MGCIIHIKPNDNTCRTECDVPEDRPPPFDQLVNYHFTGLVNKIDIEIEIVIDDIARSRDKYRRKANEDKVEPVNIWVHGTIRKTGMITQYTRRNCVRAINTRFGQRMSFRNADISVKQKN